MGEGAPGARFPPVEDPQRGRRKVPRAVRERQMLDVAGGVFAARGFHAASMDEIAEGAGISKPMIYSYFGSKEGLYFAYIELAGQRLLSRMAEAAASVDDAGNIDPERRLLASALALFSHVDENREEWSVLFGELAARGAPFSREVAAVRRAITSRTAALFDIILQRAKIDPAAVGGTEPLAYAFVGAGESLANWWLDNPHETVEAMAHRLLDVAWVGLKSLLREPARLQDDADLPAQRS
jgi:AcrR family transcriptional regulator